MEKKARARERREEVSDPAKPATRMSEKDWIELSNKDGHERYTDVTLLRFAKVCLVADDARAESGRLAQELAEAKERVRVLEEQAPKDAYELLDQAEARAEKLAEALRTVYACLLDDPENHWTCRAEIEATVESTRQRRRASVRRGDRNSDQRNRTLNPRPRGQTRRSRTMTPTEVEAGVAKTNAIVVAALAATCPFLDSSGNPDAHPEYSLAYADVMVRQALRQGWATPEQLAASIVSSVKNSPKVSTPSGQTWNLGPINSEGYTDLATRFAPHGTKHTGPTPAAILANALQTANVQAAKDGKPFLGLDGLPYEKGRTPGYDVALVALTAAATAPAPPFGVGAWNGVERRTGPQHVRASDSGAAANTGGGQAHVG